jgi:hypothetical protein
VLALAIKNPSFLVMDHLDCYVANESVNLVVAKQGSKVCLLPTNTTAFCQLLDVRVMGSLKAKIHSICLSAATWTIAVKQKCTVEVTIKAFKDISEKMIKRAWDKSTFLIEEDNTEEGNMEENNANNSNNNNAYDDS